MKCEKLGNHTISYQSLLLSTTVLNDMRVRITCTCAHDLYKLCYIPLITKVSDFHTATITVCA